MLMIRAGGCSISRGWPGVWCMSQSLINWRRGICSNGPIIAIPRTAQWFCLLVAIQHGLQARDSVLQGFQVTLFGTPGAALGDLTDYTSVPTYAALWLLAIAAQLPPSALITRGSRTLASARRGGRV